MKGKRDLLTFFLLLWEVLKAVIRMAWRIPVSCAECGAWYCPVWVFEDERELHKGIERK